MLKLQLLGLKLVDFFSHLSPPLLATILMCGLEVGAFNRVGAVESTSSTHLGSLKTSQTE